EDSSQCLVPPPEAFARDDGAKRFGEMIAPPAITRGGVHPGGGERLEARAVADGRGRRQKSYRQRPGRVLQCLAKVVQSQPAGARRQRLVRVAADGGPLRAAVAIRGSLLL